MNRHLNRITGATKLAGLFGCPVKHTISPRMHNAAFARLNLDIIYLPFCVFPRDLKKAVASLAALGFIGINVTVPHKQKIMKYLDAVSPAARRIGAVNTVLVRGSKLIGYNTDGIGFIKSLQSGLGYSLKNRIMFILGAGGAGRAVAVQSALSGVKRIYVADKDNTRARALAAAIPGKKGREVRTTEKIKDAIREADIIVNATPVGLNKSDPASITPGWIPAGKLVYDLIYNPPKTKLLKGVKGCRTVNGLGMLLYQGISSFEIWTGEKAPPAVMKKAILA